MRHEFEQENRVENVEGDYFACSSSIVPHIIQFFVTRNVQILKKNLLVKDYGAFLYQYPTVNSSRDNTLLCGINAKKMRPIYYATFRAFINFRR